MKIAGILLFCMLIGVPAIAPAETTVTTASGDTTTVESKPEKVRPVSSRGFVMAALMYLPNRVFDLCDIFRARLRVGPGAAVGVRATAPLEVYLGSYVSVWAGLPGPRQKAIPVIPLGLESYNGVAVSLAEGTFDGGIGPKYSPTEIGLTLHLLLVGVDLDVDPVEVLDFITGIIGIEVRKDDL